MQKKKKADQGETIQFCTFRFRNQLFGVDILEVKEIDRLMPFTPVHHAPSEVKGLVNIRGQIYLILNMAALMNEENLELKPENRLLIFKETVGESFGILVDKIGDVIEIATEKITQYDEAKSEKLDGNKGHLESGVCQLEEELMVVLSGKDILKRVAVTLGVDTVAS